jgi:hypothetical protein
MVSSFRGRVDNRCIPFCHHWGISRQMDSAKLCRLSITAGRIPELAPMRQMCTTLFSWRNTTRPKRGARYLPSHFSLYCNEKKGLRLNSKCMGSLRCGSRHIEPLSRPRHEALTAQSGPLPHTKPFSFNHKRLDSEDLSSKHCRDNYFHCEQALSVEENFRGQIATRRSLFSFRKSI